MKYFTIFFSFLLLNCAVNQQNTTPKTTTADETAEFAMLLEKNKIDKKQRTAEALTLIMNNDPKENKVSIRFINKSNCDLIIRIFGNKDYLLPVSKNDQNFVILEKGYYNIKYNMCNHINTEHFQFTDSSSYSISEKQ